QLIYLQSVSFWITVFLPQIGGEMPFSTTNPEGVRRCDPSASEEADICDQLLLDRDRHLACGLLLLANQARIICARRRLRAVDLPRAHDRKTILSQEFDWSVGRFQLVNLKLASLCSHDSPALSTLERTS